MQLPQDEYDMEEATGYKTDASDEDTIYQVSLRVTSSLVYRWMVNAHVPAYSAQAMSQCTMQNVMAFGNGSTADGAMQGYEWFQQGANVYPWHTARVSNTEFIEDAEALIPEGPARKTGAELTRTQRRRAERRRAEQRRRLAAASSEALEEDDTNTISSEQHILAEATPTSSASNAGEVSEITRTQRRRLQRRRAEQRLQMEMQQQYKVSQFEGDCASSAFIADGHAEVLKLGRFQQARRFDRREAPHKAEQEVHVEHSENHEIDTNKQFPRLGASIPCIHAVSDASSTCARSSCSLCSTPASRDASPTVSEPDDTHEEEEKGAKFSIDDLMRWRPDVRKSERSEIYLSACRITDDQKPQELDFENHVLRRHSFESEVMAFKPSPTSWVARQELRRNRDANAQCLTDDELVRRMKSILNKLTVEKFPTLSKQLVSCGIQTAAHLEILINEIVAKATTQHHFIDMYADLCSMLHAHVSNESRDDSSMNVKKVLLNACQDSFESHLTTLASLQTEEEANQLDKSQMIGTLKFIGAILLRKMLASKVMFYIFEELIGLSHLSEALECLVTLLRVVGPSFDHSHREGLSEIFDQVAAFASDHMIRPRVRWLLKDVLELRACGWQDSKTKRIDSSSSLEEVAQKFDDVDDCFDKATMQKELASTFGDLLLSQNMQKAVARIAAINVPPQLQAEQLCDLLQFMAEMNVETVRALGFKFIVAIFTGSHWMPSAFEDGFRNFTRLCGEGRIKAPALAKVIQDEMIPAFRPLVNRGMLSSPFPRIYS
eukprot:CAMPEP_0169425136 /NCGR_PEP_ID=MMETSP1017-20121227/68406_1 /TAXON_ID=342587 /ORGANISM="Karlodinium micrum, Strain CCMP2283" /LENGTH=777 /DNA_ID=CAMNT_0009534953 /DNA_START=12 /DNA_END=2344 /DNA_ORIENTATION=-